MKIIFSEKCLEYSQPGHPESPRRVSLVYERLKDEFEVIAPGNITDEDILMVHSDSFLRQIKSESFYDADSPAYAGIYSYALASAGGAMTAAELALKKTPSMSLMRPPGHHAGKDFLGGFCYFNNIAIAVVRALRKVKRVAVIDFDCHHGNGTQDIFLGHENIIYVSLHQSPLYPGTGFRSELNCLNYPVSAGTGESEYLAVLAKALKEVKKFAPDLIAVSAGFDTFKEDPITGLNLDVASYERIGRRIAALDKPTFSVLEGGYSSRMGDCVYRYLKGLAG
ncbi:MAG: histone deacetylase family protein [Candidatus Zixiibacteriota bacterium]|nr:MAG: histone deacetylase family protein [candidate division Zixibacteria bacterium]